jgi:hypothetical protein
MNDYTTNAKSEFQIKVGKLSKHDILYDILRRSLPKYEIAIDNIHPKEVAWVLALLDNDRECALECNAIGVAANFPVVYITALSNSDVGNNNVDNTEAEPVLTDDVTSASNSGCHCAVLDDLTIPGGGSQPSIGGKSSKYRHCTAGGFS